MRDMPRDKAPSHRPCSADTLCVAHVHEVCLGSAQPRHSGERVLDKLTERGNFEGGSLTWAFSDVGRPANVFGRIQGTQRWSEQQVPLGKSQNQQSYKCTRLLLRKANRLQSLRQ